MPAWPERYQDNWWAHPFEISGLGHRRSHQAEIPFAEWDLDYRKWTRAGQPLHGHKSTKFFSRPHDGKRAGGMGRFKDALTGEGADVFVTISGDRRTRMRDRPQRWQWTGWGLSPEEHYSRTYDKDVRDQDFMPIWERNGTRAARRARPKYDFNRREFVSQGLVDKAPWSVLRNAQWPERARRNEVAYLTAEDGSGMPFNYVDWRAGYFAGGRPVLGNRNGWWV